MLFTRENKGKILAPRHIWTCEVEQCSPETCRCICPDLTAARFYDIRCCAHMTESAERLEHCTGKSHSLHDVVKAHLINSASWISLTYITYMETYYISHAHVIQPLIFETDQRSTSTKDTNAISGSGRQINRTLIYVTSGIMCSV